MTPRPPRAVHPPAGCEHGTCAHVLCCGIGENGSHHICSPTAESQSKRKNRKVEAGVQPALPSPGSMLYRRSVNREMSCLVRNSDSTWKAGKKDGGFVSQGTILPKLEFRLLLHYGKRREQHQTFLGSRQPPERMCRFLLSCSLSLVGLTRMCPVL